MSAIKQIFDPVEKMDHDKNQFFKEFDKLTNARGRLDEKPCDIQAREIMRIFDTEKVSLFLQIPHGQCPNGQFNI